jgi:hypothetical protein
VSKERSVDRDTASKMAGFAYQQELWRPCSSFWLYVQLPSPVAMGLLVWNHQEVSKFSTKSVVAGGWVDAAVCTE